MTIYSIIALSYLLYSLPEFYNTAKSILRRDVSLFEALRCSKCLAFWVTLIFSGCITYALLVSLCVLLMESFIVTRL